MAIHEIVKQIRSALGLSQVAFAQQIHVSFSTVNRWENGRAQPNKLAILALIDLCQKEQVCLDVIVDLRMLSESNATALDLGV